MTRLSWKPNVWGFPWRGSGDVTRLLSQEVSGPLWGRRPAALFYPNDEGEGCLFPMEYKAGDGRRAGH